MIGGGVALTLAIALAVPFALFYTDTSFKDSDDIRAEFADVDAIVISRVPEVERHYANGQLKSADPPLALMENGSAGASNGHEQSASDQSRTKGHAAKHRGVDG